VIIQGGQGRQTLHLQPTDPYKHKNMKNIKHHWESNWGSHGWQSV